jgi:hypothetical protein
MYPGSCQLVAWKLCFQATGLQHRGCIIPQAVTHGIMLEKMGGLNAQNMFS